MFVDNDCVQLRRGILLQRDQWTGWRHGEKRAVLRGAPPPMPRWSDRLRNTLVSRNLYLNTLHLDEAEVEAFARRVLHERPMMLFGHAHSLYLFARFWEARALPAYQFRAALCTAMPLPHHERETLQSVFGAAVFDRYGSEELSLIATECEAHEGLHINTDSLAVEVVPDGISNDGGRIVVTDLWNRGMPLIRYDLGDRVVLEPKPCSCGRTDPLLRTVTGRVADYLWTPDGRRVSGAAITEHFAELFPDVEQVQIVQRRVDHVLVRLVPGPAPADRIAAGVARVVEAAFGAAMRYEIESVSSMEPEASGKFRFTICEVPETERARIPEVLAPPR
jgi:phenylacetate-CoA ligase